MSKRKNPFSDEIYEPWEATVFHSPPLSSAERLPRLEKLLNQIRPEKEWLYPFDDCEMVSQSLVGVYVLEGNLEAAADLARAIENHPDYKASLPTNFLAAECRILEFRLGDHRKGTELIEFLTSGRIPKSDIFNLIGLIVDLYESNAPLPPTARELCINLANIGKRKTLAKKIQSATTASKVAELNREAAIANYNKRHPKQTPNDPDAATLDSTAQSAPSNPQSPATASMPKPNPKPK